MYLKDIRNNGKELLLVNGIKTGTDIQFYKIQFCPGVQSETKHFKRSCNVYLLVLGPIFLETDEGGRCPFLPFYFT